MTCRFARWCSTSAAALGVAALRGVALHGVALHGQDRAPASIEPPSPIAATLVADTDGDGRDELILVDARGEVARHVLGPAGFEPRGSMRLSDPAHSLLAVADFDPDPGMEIVVADGSGTACIVWPADPARVADVRALLRRARCTLRLDRPQATSFVQDLNRDGRLDVLLPTLQGVLPFVQEPAGEDGASRFRAMPLLPVAVRVEIENRTGGQQEQQGRLVVPSIDTADLNGDGRPDLLTRVADRHGFHLQADDGTFSAPVEVDLGQFVDSTPKATLALGDTAVLGDRQLLQRGDVDGDGIPDFVIAHRRKLWTFLGSKDGPQFVRARTQAVADDVTAMLVIDLDEDKDADLLAFQVQLPSMGSLLLGLVQSLDVDVKAVGYRSEGGAFTAIPAWRRVVTLRVPPLLSLLSRQEELVRRFTEMVAKVRIGVRGAFTGPDRRDLALVRGDGAVLELFPQAGDAPSLGGAAGRQLMVRLLFEDEDPVFDLERLFGIMSGLLDDLAGGLVGDRVPAATAPLRDPKQWRLADLVVGELDGAAPAELVACYEAIETGQRSAEESPVCSFDLVVWRAK